MVLNWRPHCALALMFNSIQAAIPVQQLRTFPLIGKAFHPPMSWSSFPEKHGPLYILNYQITGLGTDLARWCTQSEQHLTQQLLQPELGRGSQIDLFTAPLQGPRKIQLWKKGRPAFWERMAIRINVLYHNPEAAVYHDLIRTRSKICSSMQWSGTSTPSAAAGHGGQGVEATKDWIVDIVFDCNRKHPDPGDSIVQQHAQKILHSFKESKQRLFWTSDQLECGFRSPHTSQVPTAGSDRTTPGFAGLFSRLWL